MFISRINSQYATSAYHSVKPKTQGVSFRGDGNNLPVDRDFLAAILKHSYSINPSGHTYINDSVNKIGGRYVHRSINTDVLKERNEIRIKEVLVFDSEDE